LALNQESNLAKTIFDATSRQQLLDRLARLRPDSARRWGRMTPNEMMCHLEDSMRVATGESQARARESFLSNPLMRRLVIYHMPWPKGKAQTVPEMLATRPSEFEADRKRLSDWVRKAGERGPNAAWAPHPAFGKMSGRDYGVLIYRHVDYHLRQFGV
jgi:hypothetical protein